MPSVELSKLQGISAARPLSGSERAQVEKPAATPRGAGAPSGGPGVRIEVGSAIAAGAPPVDTDRVSEVRAALKAGDYPLVPAKIVDAMIAARYSFESRQ